MPALWLSSTPVKCGTVPAPGVAKLALPGLVFIQARIAFRSPLGAPGPAVIAKSNVTARATGVKSRTGSKPRFLYSHGETTRAPLGARIKVWPSGAARFTSPSATRPAAPGLLSMITFCASVTRILSASRRATMSAEPPGGKPTRMRIGGLSCAHAGSAPSVPSIEAAAVTNVRRWIMTVSSLWAARSILGLVQWRITVARVMTSALWLVDFPWFQPQFVQAFRRGGRMKLISWNTQWCRGLDGTVSPQRIVEAARAMADFDVLCLQEISQGFHRLQGAPGDQPAQIAA